jgi:hypothetical protein
MVRTMQNLLKFQKIVKYGTLLVTLTFVLGMLPASPEEGMYPLSEIDKVDLRDAGLKIDPKEVYNPNGISLVDALVQLSGCTGSFISDKGLIITNHHCAFGIVANSSSVEKNYLENGFHASTFGEEIPATGYTCKITESYKDVSDYILSAVKNTSDPAERTKIIAKKIQELSESATNESESIVANVSEMFAGKTYILFKYRIIRDVRLVYAPPQSIGNFGGETDNWVWPRHTGDFSIMRAYVAPDGKAVPYSKNNIPFTPKKYLKINPNGIEEGDFVFMLGYPGRTYRHRPSQYIRYQQDFLLPYISRLYGYAINTMQHLGKDNKALQLEFANRIKGLANTMKNFDGKLKGLKRLDLVSQKIDEENQIKNFINADGELKDKYGNLFDEIKNVFEDVDKSAQADLWLKQIYNFSTNLSLANFVIKYKTETAKPDTEREQAFQEKNIKQTLERIYSSLQKYNRNYEEALLNKMFDDADKFKQEARIMAFNEFVKNPGDKEKLVSMIMSSQITQKDYLDKLVAMTPEEFSRISDPVFSFVRELQKQNEIITNENNINEGKLNKLYGDLVDVKMLWKKTSFLPDANSTLRLTYGYIKGYNPTDATYMEPFTSIDGVIEKNNSGNEDFVIPDKLKTLYNKKDFGKYVSAKRGKLPVAMLYNMDTTGGNSGSPVLNAYGELIGINFDRAFEATINDFAWNESYSRSIGVDIRYVLWVLDKFSGAENILEEIGL